MENCFQKGKQVFTIVLTGGPCSGKSEAQHFLEEKLKDLGFAVFFSKEVPTEFLSTGITFADGRLSFFDFEEQTFLHMIEKEDRYRKAAECSISPKNIVIYDRAAMDVGGYFERDEFEFLFRKNNLQIVDIRDGRYDGVFHLRTTAFGKEKIYNLKFKDNPARFESPEQARINDEKVLQAWVGHPHIRIIDNSTGFEEKMERLFAAICSVLGIPEPLEIERKYLVEPVDMNLFPVPFQEVNIEQVYLRNDESGNLRRIRKRGKYDSFIYYITKKQEIRLAVRHEVEHRIAALDYARLRRDEYDPKRMPVRKKRNCFVWKDQYFELDIFQYPMSGLTLLEIELTKEDQKIDLPPFLKIIRDVTDEPAFSNSEIAKNVR